MKSLQLAKEAVRKGALQKTAELGSLIRLVRRRRLRRVVEIGTAAGGTLYVWCQLAEPDALVVSIDLPGGPFGGILVPADPRVFLQYRKGHQRLHFLRRDSHEPSTRLALDELLGGQQIDLLMIDGDHTYQGVRRDWEEYSPLVKRGGLVVFHDIHTTAAEYGVRRLWGEIKGTRRHVEVIDERPDVFWGPWGGIGVIYCGTDP